MGDITKSLILYIVIFVGSDLYAHCDIHNDDKVQQDTIRFIGGINPPYEYFDEKGEMTGFHVELVKTLMERVNCNYTIQLMSWNDARKAIENNEADILMGMYYSECRAETYSFGLAHSYLCQSIVTRESVSNPTINYIKDKTVIVLDKGMAYELIINSKLTSKIIKVRFVEEGFDMLNRGYGDLMMCNNIVARAASFESCATFYVTELKDVMPGKYCMAALKEKEYLIGMMNNLLQQLKSEGVYDKIYDEWFSIYEDKSYPKWLYYLCIVLNILFILTLIFLYLLRTQVNAVTKKLREKNKEIRLINKKLIVAKEKAERSDSIKSTFLTNMSHEVRTPLNSIVGFSALLSYAETEQERKEYQHLIETNSALLLKLVNDILDLSRIESGHLALEKTYFDINLLFIDVRNTLTELLKTVPDVEFHIRMRDEGHIIYMDRHRIEQILINFITNAVKYTNQGFIEMGYEICENTLYMYVEDTGEGIESDKLEEIFDRFIKLDSFKQGIGLGLSICKTLAETMGGEIGVKSEYGTGSRFWVKLPVEIKQPEEVSL